MKISIFTLCDFAQDNSGKLSIIGTFNKISSTSFPLVYPSFYLVCKVVSAEAVSTNAVLSVIAPNGAILLNNNITINIQESVVDGEEMSANLVYNMAGISFESPGKYQCIMKIGDLVNCQDLYIAEIQNKK